VIGYLSGRPSAEAQYLVAAFEKGLRDGGFVIGQNVAIEFRWAEIITIGFRRRPPISRTAKSR